MKAVFKKAFASLLAVSLMFSMPGCATAVKKHPEFAARRKNINSIAIMPPEITAYKLTFRGDKLPLHELIPVMEEITVSEIKTQFEKKGYKVNKLDLGESTLQANPDLRTALFDVRKIFNKALKDIQEGKQEKFAYMLGSDVNVFADIADCDALIFVIEEGVKKSAGEIVKDLAQSALLSAAALCVGIIVMPIPKTAATIIHVAIVDANNGDILWYTNNQLSPDIDPENKSQLRSAVRGQVAGFPKIFSPKAK